MELENQCSKYIIALSATNEYFFEYDSQKDTNTIFYMSSIDNEMLERPGVRTYSWTPKGVK